VFWDFPGGGYCCPECGEPFTLLGDHVSGQQLDWQVVVRLVAHCRRRYRRACECRVPGTVMAPGPPWRAPQIPDCRLCVRLRCELLIQVLVADLMRRPVAEC
jgi:hypothetical protein